MSKSVKKLVRAFYESDAFKNSDTMKQFIHPECELFWNSSKGFTKLDYNGLLNLSEELAKSYESLRTAISHLMRDKNTVTARYTYFVNTIENPDEEIALAHFITIWEVKDDKLYRGYEISQLADDDPVNMKSFLDTKV